MKKTIVAAITIATSLTAAAEGYQVNTLSARQLGMGHTGVAQKLGAESMFFNPAGMGFMDQRMDISAAVSPIFPTATTTLPDGSKFTTDNEASTPMMIDLGFSIYDNLKAGIAFYTPYGSNINWTDNWPGSVLNQSVKLQTFTVQPSVAWRPIRGLSVGAGLMITWGSVDLNKGLVSASSVDAVLAMSGIDYSFGQTTPASVNLKGTSQIAVGVNVGAMYDIDSHWTVGASYRSRMSMKVKAGDASLTYANDLARNLLQEKLDMINNANFKAEMPCPWVLNFGASYHPAEQWTIAADAQLTGWHTYHNLNIEFLDSKLDAYNQHLRKNYHNAWAVKLGAEYAVTQRFDVRAGLMVDATPVDKQYYNPETPGMTRVNPSVGLSFSPIKGMSIDAAFMYVIGCGRDNATCKYEDLMMKSLGMPYEKEFKADYNLHAFIPSIGLRYSF